MRLTLAALIAVAGASAASAEVVQDRYGPPRKAQPMALAALGSGAYSGPMLGWSGKAAPRVEAPAPAPQAPMRQEPARQPAPQTYGPQAYAPAPAATVMPTPRYAPRPAPVAAAAPAPQFAPATNRPAPDARASAPVQRQKPVLAGGPPETAPQSPAVQTAAASPRPGAAPRYYSLHREYGRTPDAIPPQAMAPRYVLIGPPDAPSAPADDDDNDAPKSSGQF